MKDNMFYKKTGDFELKKKKKKKKKKRPARGFRYKLRPTDSTRRRADDVVI